MLSDLSKLCGLRLRLAAGSALIEWRQILAQRHSYREIIGNGGAASVKQQLTGQGFVSAIYQTMQSPPNLYQLLQVDRKAEPSIIRYAYRFLAAMFHPDNSETGNRTAFKELTEAWRILSDEGKRATYDRELENKSEFAPPNIDAVFFETLQVAPGAHPVIIRIAYQYLAKKYHPENGENRDAGMYTKIMEAWRAVGDGAL